MNCQQCQEMMIDYWGGHLTPEQRSLFDAHLAVCPTCSRNIEEVGLIPYLVRCEHDAVERTTAAVLSVVRGMADDAETHTDASAVDRSRHGLRIISFKRFVALAASLLLVFGVHWLLTRPSTEKRMASLTMPTSKSKTSTPYDNAWEDVEPGSAAFHVRELGRNSNDKNDSSDSRGSNSIDVGSVEQRVQQNLTTLACAVLTVPKTTDLGSLAFNLSAESDARQSVEPFLSRQVLAVVSPENGELFGAAYALDRKRGLYVGPSSAGVKTVLFEWVTAKENRLFLAADFVAEADVVSYEETTGFALLYCGALRNPDDVPDACAAPLAAGIADLPVVTFRKAANGNLRLMEGTVNLGISQEGVLTQAQEDPTLPAGSAILSENWTQLIGMVTRVGSGPVAIVSRVEIATFIEKSRDECDQAEKGFLEHVRQCTEQAKQIAATTSGSPTSENVDGDLLCQQADGYRIVAIDSDKDHKPDFCTHSAHPGLIRIIPADTPVTWNNTQCEALAALWAGCVE